MKTKTRITILILLIVVGVFQISWHRKNPAKVKIGYIEHSSALPFLIAYERGYFRKEGVDVELVLCGFKNFMDTLLTGRVDLITATSFPALFGRPFKILWHGRRKKRWRVGLRYFGA